MGRIAKQEGCIKSCFSELDGIRSAAREVHHIASEVELVNEVAPGSANKRLRSGEIGKITIARKEYGHTSRICGCIDGAADKAVRGSDTAKLQQRATGDADVRMKTGDVGDRILTTADRRQR